MKELPAHIIKILLSHQSDDLTLEQILVLNRYFSDNKEMLSEANAILKLSDSSKDIKQYLAIDVNTAWHTVDSKTLPQPGWRFNKRFRIIQYAASILLPLISAGIVLWYLNYMPNTVSDTIVKVESIEKGQSKAILELGNGNRIVLGQKRVAEISSGTGFIIAKDSANQLNYTSKNINQIEYNTLSIPKGGEYKLLLADGTNVWLNSQTKLRYPTQFANNTREIQLLEGEIFLEVKENKAKPFVVKGNEYDIRVLGTGFNVRNYKDEANMATTLVHGSVQINQHNNGKQCILQPNQQVSIDENGLMCVKNVDVKLYASWVNGILYYKGETLDNILRDLSRWYSFEYKFTNVAIANKRFGGGISRYDDFKKVLDVITTTNKLKTTITDGVIIISDK